MPVNWLRNHVTLISYALVHLAFVYGYDLRETFSVHGYCLIRSMLQLLVNKCIAMISSGTGWPVPKHSRQAL